MFYQFIQYSSSGVVRWNNIPFRIRSGILVPGGFGVRGTEGKICAINWARKQKKPFLGTPDFTVTQSTVFIYLLFNVTLNAVMASLLICVFRGVPWNAVGRL